MISFNWGWTNSSETCECRYRDSIFLTNYLDSGNYRKGENYRRKRTGIVGCQWSQGVSNVKCGKWWKKKVYEVKLQICQILIYFRALCFKLLNIKMDPRGFIQIKYVLEWWLPWNITKISLANTVDFLLAMSFFLLTEYWFSSGTCL